MGPFPQIAQKDSLDKGVSLPGFRKHARGGAGGGSMRSAEAAVRQEYSPADSTCGHPLGL